MVAGDVHGDSHHMKYLSERAERLGIPTILQVGDFGYWPHMDPEFLYRTQHKLANRGQHLYWIDGNHENFDAIDHFDTSPSGFKTLPPVYGDDRKTFMHNVHYIPRGHYWLWDGVRFAGFGGAPSIDKDMRVYRGPGHPANSWWPQEIPSRDDENRVFDGPQNSADVLLLHDSPVMPPDLPYGYKDDAISAYNRKLMAAIVDHIRPKVIYHGHYHHPHLGEYNGIPIRGLDRDGSYENSYHVLNTEDYL